MTPKKKAAPMVSLRIRYRRAQHHTIRRRPGAKGRNERIVFLEGFPSLLAWRGYWTPQVQKVVSKWKEKIPETALEHLFASVTESADLALKRKAITATFKVEAPEHWSLVWQLLAALDAVYSDTANPACWLFRLSHGTRIDGRWPSWKEICQAIQKAGGPIIEPHTLHQRAKRLRLVPSQEGVEDYLQSVSHKAP